MVWIYLGLSAESPSARRNILIAVLMPWSKSTTVSLGQSFFWISSRVTSSAAHDQDPQHLQRLFLQQNGLSVLVLLQL